MQPSCTLPICYAAIIFLWTLSITFFYVSITIHLYMRIYLLDSYEYVVPTFYLLLFLVIVVFLIHQSFFLTLYPCLLPASIMLTLYVTAITNAPTLYTIEGLPFYESGAISQELVSLLLDTFCFQLHYIHTTFVSNQALLLLNRDLSKCTLNALHLHSFYTYLEHLKSKLLLPVFLPIYQSLLPIDQEQYQTISTSIPGEPQIEVMLTPLPVPPPCSPSTLSTPLISHISSQPVSSTKTLILESGFSCKNALLTASFVAQSLDERRIMASPTQTLPCIYLPAPATPST